MNAISKHLSYAAVFVITSLLALTPYARCSHHGSGTVAHGKIARIIHTIERTELPDDIRSIVKESTRTIQRRSDFEALLDTLIGLFPELEPLYAYSPIASIGYSLREHTMMVHAVLRQQLPYYRRFLSSETIALLHLIVALHDSGKPIALQEHYDQHAATMPLVRALMRALDYTPHEIAIAQAIIDHDSIGTAVMRHQPVETAQKQLRHQLEISGLAPEEFVAAQFLFYVSDANSYPPVHRDFKGILISGITAPSIIERSASANEQFVTRQASRDLLVARQEAIYRALMESVAPGFWSRITTPPSIPTTPPPTTAVKAPVTTVSLSEEQKSTINEQIAQNFSAIRILRQSLKRLGTSDQDSTRHDIETLTQEIEQLKALLAKPAHS